MACTGRTVIDQSFKHIYKKYKRVTKGYIFYACCRGIKIDLNMVLKTSRKYSIVFDKQQDTYWKTVWLMTFMYSRLMWGCKWILVEGWSYFQENDQSQSTACVHFNIQGIPTFRDFTIRDPAISWFPFSEN